MSCTLRRYTRTIHASDTDPYCSKYDGQTTTAEDITFVCENPPEKRVRPESFKDSLTSQAEQLTFRSKLLHYSYKAGWADCGSVPGGRTWYRYLAGQRLHPDYFRKPDVSTNWQLDLRLKIKDEVVNLGNSLVEYRETGNMFLDAAKGVKNFIKAAKKGKGRRWSSCDVVNIDLANTYGVQPLVSDLKDSYDRLTERLIRPVKKRYYVAKQVDIDDFESTYGSTFVFPDKFIKSERAVFYVVFPADPPNFTLGHPGEWIWEKLPYSHVVDWMIPIGDYLASLDALRYVKDIYGTVTTKESYHGKWNLKGVSNLDTVEWGQLDADWHRRTRYNDIPLPDPPKYEPSKSLKAVKNGLELLWQGREECKNRGNPYR